MNLKQARDQYTILPLWHSRIRTAQDALGMTSPRYPIGSKSYNVSGTRQAYNEIDSTFRQLPEIAEIAGSFFLLEGYSTQAVKAIDPESTVSSHRDDDILVTSYVMYSPNPTIDPIAKESGEKLRKIVFWMEARIRDNFALMRIMLMVMSRCKRLMGGRSGDWKNWGSLRGCRIRRAG